LIFESNRKNALRRCGCFSGRFGQSLCIVMLDYRFLDDNIAFLYHTLTLNFLIFFKFVLDKAMKM